MRRNSRVVVVTLTAAAVVGFVALAAAVAQTREGPVASRPATAPGPASLPAWVMPTVKAASQPATMPITLAGSPVGKLLKQWWSEGTAAGNVGDVFDNRDRGHSDLGTANWPQLGRTVYSPQALERRVDWAGQRLILPWVTFGNSSTSAGVSNGGSNVRMYYVSGQGLAFLHEEYRRNNVYMYPEHVDHDPGHNGVGGGHGDLYPTNTPYVFTSQGSSGSDQPFMRAVPNTLAAFRPDVKKKLAETGLLMPTIQMILRSCNNHIKDPDEYLTGKAHPTVFEGSWVDDLKMVNMAHKMKIDNLPPLAQIKVISEDVFVNGEDFFEPGRGEVLGDTPEVVARLWRAMQGRRRMVVSAESSIELNKKPLTYKWVLLRGDDKGVTITPDKDGARATIVVEYPYRRPVQPGSALESNRVDIGVFANNGGYWSPPAFITFYGLDDEARTYDDKGRLIDIGCGAGETTLAVNWTAMLDLLGDASMAPPLKQSLGEPKVAAILKVQDEYKQAAEKASDAQRDSNVASAAARRAGDAVKAAEKRVAELPTTKPAATSQQIADANKELADLKEAQKTADADVRKAQQAATEAQKASDEALARNRDDLGGSVKGVVESALNAMLDDMAFAAKNAKLFGELAKDADRAKALQAARKRLIGYGLAKDEPGNAVTLTPVMSVGGAKPPRAASSAASAPTSAAAGGPALTRFEKCLLQRFNGDVLSGVLYPKAVTATFRVNYVDTRLASPKAWRDVFTYDSAGKRATWTRYDGQKAIHVPPNGPPPAIPAPK